jgi:hypothetical protein
MERGVRCGSRETEGLKLMMWEIYDIGMGMGRRRNVRG